MANYQPLSNEEATKITESQSERSENFKKLKEYLSSRGLEFIYERNTGFVGINPENPDASYTMVAVPTFTRFDFSQTQSHLAATIVSYYTGERGNHVAAISEITHKPLRIEKITLIEIGKDGNIVETPVDRKTLESESPEEIGKRMSVKHLDSPNRRPLDTSIAREDEQSMAVSVLNQLLQDNFAAPLYPEGGVQTLIRDSGISSSFASAVSFRPSLFDLGFEITVCTSTSSNACSSCSSTLTIDI